MGCQWKKEPIEKTTLPKLNINKIQHTVESYDKLNSEYTGENLFKLD